MISQDFIKTLATKYQTTELNIQREYLQHLFLSLFYQNPSSENILFKGGTALRFIYRSPRFSEDLDFSGSRITIEELEKLILKTLSLVEEQGIRMEIDEAKITSGGYLSIFNSKFLKENIKIQLEISFRKAKELEKEVSLIAQDFVLPYTIIHLTEKQLVTEKIGALLERAKVRDWYDLYFILRNRLEIDFSYLSIEKKVLKKAVLKEIQKMKSDEIGKDLKSLLPASHHHILRNFKESVGREVERYL